MSPVQFYKCLADETRLRSLLLITLQGELCVCELQQALDASQPKISRHLAELRACGLLRATRRGKWVYYDIDPALPDWAVRVLQNTAEHNRDFLAASLVALNAFGAQASC